MPTAGKLFLYIEDLSMEDIAGRLDGYFTEEAIEEEGETVNIGTRIVDVRTVLGEVVGSYERDAIRHDTYRGTPSITPYTLTAGFRFFVVDGAPYLLVMGRKVLSNSVANELSTIVHGEIGAIVEPVLNLRLLQELYEKGEGTKILLFDEMDIPNLNKATIYGTNVIQTDFYGRFLNRGSPWYVVFKDQRRGYTVGLVRDASVCIFTSVEPDEFIDYVTEDVIPLVLTRR